MKITLVLPCLLLSGGVRTFFECANGLRRRGHKVTVVYPSFRLTKPSRFEPDTMTMLAKEALRELSHKPRINWFPLEAELCRVPFLNSPLISLVEHKIPDADVVVASTWESAYSVARLSPSKGRKAYFVQHYEAMGLWNNEDCWRLALQENPAPRGIFRSMAGITPPTAILRRHKKLVDASYSLPLAKFTTSVVLEELITGCFRQPSFGRIPIGNNTAIFYPEGAKAARNVILIPFRGFGWKGSADVLELIRILKSRRNDFQVILFGHESMRQAVPAGIDFRGSISDAELRRLYTQADIFVSPTWVEGWCSPPMEAMSCGTACVSTDVGALSEFADDGKTALLVPPRSPEKMADAVCRLLDDKALRAKLAGAGQEKISAYTWDRAAGAMEKILTAVADGQAS